jgi:hypothetical protein
VRILHVWDQAGVACILAKYQIRQGHQSKVLKIKGDKYGIYHFYSEFITEVPEEQFFVRCIEEASRADIIHIHGPINVLFKLRQRFGKSKIIILQYLGTDIRGLNPSPISTTPVRPSILSIVIKSIATKLRGLPLPKQYIHILAQMLADKVLVATPDLIQSVVKGIYLPIPVDTEHFFPNHSPNKNRKCALTLNTEVTNISKAMEYCRRNEIDLDIEVYDRTKEPIMYADMPKFLKKYRIYVDIRYIKQTLLNNLSSTALQSLACGLRVLDYQLKYCDIFPIEHEADNVATQALRHYVIKEKSFLGYLWYLIFRLTRS